MEVSPEAPSSYPPPPGIADSAHTRANPTKKRQASETQLCKKVSVFCSFPRYPPKKIPSSESGAISFFFQERRKRSCSTKSAAAFKAQHFHRLNAKEVSVSHFWSVFFFLGFVTAGEKRDPPTHGASFFPPPLKRERGILVVGPAPGFGFLVAVPITKAVGDEF